MNTTTNQFKIKSNNHIAPVAKNSLGIRGRLFMGFGSILLILIIAIGIILIKVTTAEYSAKQVMTIELPTYDAYLDLNGYLYASEAALQGWMLTHDTKYKDNYAIAWDNINRAVTELNSFSKNWESDTQNEWITATSLLNQIKESESKILAATSTDSASANQLLSSELSPLIDKALNVLDGHFVDNNRTGGLYDVQRDRLQNGAQEVIDNMNVIKMIEYGLLLIGIALSLFITFFTARKILRPLHSAINVAKNIAAGERNSDIVITSNDETGELLTALNAMQIAIQDNEEKLKDSEMRTRELFDNIIQTANIFSAHSSKVAAGDLTQRLKIKSTEEMSRLGDDLNTMTQSLATITTQITDACHNMVTTLEEVKHAVEAQSSGASEQASSINQITASLEEIEKSSTQTIDKAKMLGEVAERTRTKGQLGLEAVEESIKGMKAVREKVQAIAQTILDLSNQTQQVGDITAVVNTLAQQSKMLALNASIEAAKAGEAGKGFAVVALEVKNLAEQSEQSTIQVQKILEDISRATEKAVMATEEGTKGVDYGTELVGQTGAIVRSLSEIIHEATIASQQIEASIRQEGIGIEQITAGMSEINQVTGSFVSSVNQTTEAIENLSTIAKNLKMQIDLYKV